MFKDVMFVCTGNICRSPMAEYILKNRFNSSDDIRISSAGTHALVPYPADGIVLDLMHNKGYDLSNHRAKQLNLDNIFSSDLILTMTLEQQKYIEKCYPSACGKVHRVGKWSEFDVMDPYKRPLVVFEQVYELLLQGIDDWYRKLWVKNV
jgi:protein-tyrosine phosphatase